MPSNGDEIVNRFLEHTFLIVIGSRIKKYFVKPILKMFVCMYLRDNPNA